MSCKDAVFNSLFDGPMSPPARVAPWRDGRRGGKSNVNSRGDALDIALTCRLVVIDVVCDRMEADDFFLRLV
jgi:hypothetical protein